MTADFWDAADALLDSRELVADRPAGSDHPRNPGWRYPLDYGHLVGTTGGDGAEIDVWVGTEVDAGVTGILCTMDPGKGDAEVKLLWRCSPADVDAVLAFYNGAGMGVVHVPRP